MHWRHWVVSAAMMLHAVGGPATHKDIIAEGLATYYAPGKMQEVYYNRLAWGHVSRCKECIGMVAMGPHRFLNKKVYVKINNRIHGPFLVIDCANLKNYGGQVIEFDFHFWFSIGLPRRPILVQVLY